MREFVIRGIKTSVYAAKADAGRAAAAYVAEELQRALTERGTANVVFAAAPSQNEFLGSLVADTRVDWSRVNAFHLDEYIGLSETHPASFRRYLWEHLFQHLPFQSVHLLDGNAANPQHECARYSELLKQNPLDVACIGIGENGHLAFNDPPADFATRERVQVVTLDEACRKQQVGEGHFPTFADVPRTALTLTIPAILTARVISCVVPDARKAQAVRDTLLGDVTLVCPASALQKHPACRLYLDEASASLLPV